MRARVSCSSAALFLVLAHLPFLTAPYFWDEAGQFIPASLDIFYGGELVPHSTIPNVHPPGVMLYLAGIWRVFGYSIAGTRARDFAARDSGLLVRVPAGRGLPLSGPQRRPNDAGAAVHRSALLLASHHGAARHAGDGTDYAGPRSYSCTSAWFCRRLPVSRW